jgi:hypothetical protein
MPVVGLPEISPSAANRVNQGRDDFSIIECTGNPLLHMGLDQTRLRPASR